MPSQDSLNQEINLGMGLNFVGQCNSEQSYFRKYECRCVLPLLNSSIELIDQDHRAPGITALLKV